MHSRKIESDWLEFLIRDKQKYYISKKNSKYPFVLLGRNLILSRDSTCDIIIIENTEFKHNEIITNVSSPEAV